jgi:hypothetical protein
MQDDDVFALDVYGRCAPVRSTYASAESVSLRSLEIRQGAHYDAV